MAEIKIQKIEAVAEDVKQAITRKSAASLPYNPTEKGFKPHDIIAMLYKPIIDTAQSAIAEIDRVIDAVNASLEELANNTELEVEKKGIQSISHTGTDENGGNKYIISYNSGETFEFIAPRGEKGEPGTGFSISKTYPSISDMEAKFDSLEVPLYGFALIDSGDVEDPDNAKLYYKSPSGYVYLTDLSGAQGIKGDKGDPGEKGDYYLLTETDKEDIAALVLNSFPTAEDITI